MAEKRKFQFDPRITTELRAQKGPIRRGLICAGISAALYGLTIPLVKEVLANLELLNSSRRPENFTLILRSCGMIIAVFLARYAFVRGQSYYLAEAVARLTTNLRRKLMAKLLRLPVTYFNEKRSGAVQSVLTNDVNVFQSAVGILRDSIEAPIKALSALVAIFIMQWQMAIATLLMIPILGVIINRNSRRMRKVQSDVQADLAEVGAVTQESLQGVRVIKAFGAEDRASQSYFALTERSLESQLSAARIVAALKPLVEFMGALGLVCAFLIGGWLALQGKMSVSDMAALAIALDSINQGFRGISNLSSTYSSVQSAADRIYSEILDVPEPPEHVGATKLANIQGNIEFRNVSFAYPDGTVALKDASFTIPAGTSLALVGPSGAGKSTIADLLLRFYEPTSGHIYVDGVDIQTLDARWLRTQIGVVPQQTFLFAGGIEDNLRLGAPDATDDDLRRALIKAHALEFTEEFGQRNLAVLGERGVRLSGGQMQRIAIARALVHNPRMLLLDEATSALDAASEKAVTEALAEVMTSTTTLFIAHRLTTAARADSILLLKRGEVIEQGSHKQLMEKGGDYASLFKLFADGVLEDDLG